VLLSRLWHWLRGRPSLDSAPYEELLRRYPSEPEAVFHEFMRRLHEIVFMAAAEFCSRRGVPAVQDKAAELTMSAFESFLPEMGAGEPEMVLRRFAGMIRRTLDDEAFDSIERVYYRHLLLYHLQDDNQRRALEAMFASGLAATAQQIAARLLLPVATVERLLQDGNRELERIRNADFEEAELKLMTDGRLP